MTIWLPELNGERGPLYRRIVDALAHDIASGRLSPGSRLPTHRDLAWQLKVTVGTVSRAYAEAERRGLIAGEVGRGTFVRTPEPLVSADAPCMPSLSSSPAAIGRTAQRWYLQNVIRGHAEPTDERLDLSLNYPWQAPIADALMAGLEGLADRDLLAAIGGYQTANGMRRHRQAGCDWLRQFEIDADAESVIIVPGCQGGLSTTFLALCRPGDVVLHEALTWPGLHATAVPQGVRTIGLPLDEDGLTPDAFEAACREHRPRLLYMMPTLHNPTTIVMPEDRRRAIAGIAARHGVFVVEDDVYGFLLDSPMPPVRSFLPELGIYVTSLSKCLAPGLRIGYLVADPGLIPRLATAMRMSVLMISSVAAEVASRAIACGSAFTAASQQREEARARQRLARDMLPTAVLRSHPTAFHAWLTIPPLWRRDDFVTALAGRGVLVTPGSAFAGEARNTDADTHVRLCLCPVTDRTHLSRALSLIAELLDSGATPRLPVV